MVRDCGTEGDVSARVRSGAVLTLEGGGDDGDGSGEGVTARAGAPA
jgi:hypothetical protein